MKQFIAITLLLLSVASCSLEPQFKITGTIKEAKDKVIYFEKAGLEKVELIDSVKLGKSGSFTFKGKATPYPEFYRLRIEEQLINLAIDSTETVQITAEAATFETNYTVEGSEMCQQMRQLNTMSGETRKEIISLREKFNNKEIDQNQLTEQLRITLEKYKEQAKPIILNDPSSMVAYFALFQRINGYMIFDFGQKEDLRYFGAVSTSFQQKYPEWPRTINLTNMTLRAMKTIRSAEVDTEIDVPLTDAAEYLDITLHDPKGNKRVLSETLKGKVGILSLTAYATEFSVALNVELNSLYQKYAAKGLAIYQVSFDEDEHFWKTAALNLPWTCVRDPRGVYSDIGRKYNISTVPALFLFNRQGEIVERVTNFDLLDSSIAKLL